MAAKKKNVKAWQRRREHGVWRKHRKRHHQNNGDNRGEEHINRGISEVTWRQQKIVSWRRRQRRGGINGVVTWRGGNHGGIKHFAAHTHGNQ